VSATRLLILGLVRWAQPVHGYEVRRELLSWNAEEWANVAPGSIYHALKKLATEGLLREVSTERDGSRPARTRYEITEPGEREFQEMLRDYWWRYKSPVDPFLVAFSLVLALPEEEAAAALRNRVRLLRENIEDMQQQIDQGPGEDFKPPHVFDMFRLAIARWEVELAWCESVALRVERGELAVDEAVWKAGGWTNAAVGSPAHFEQ
jgi:DNA-binding PadR family transcriptional regulator